MKLLQENEFRVILLVPAMKLDFFREHYGAFVFDIVPIDNRSSGRDRLIRHMSLMFLCTKTMKIKRQTEIGKRGLWVAKLIPILLRPGLLRLIERIVPYKRRQDIEKIFEETKPTTCFLTDLQNEIDIYVLKSAHRRGVKTVGMVRSWDNLTSKGILRVLPGKVLVWNEFMKKEAIKLDRIDPNVISIIGIPHYDKYKKREVIEKQEFIKSTGVVGRSKVALFAPTGDRYLNPNNVDSFFVKTLDSLLPEEYLLFVRLPPGDRVSEIENNSFGPRVYIERPSKTFNTVKNSEIPPGEDIRLINTLANSDVLISGPSTMIIDALFFDIPIILEGFDPKPTSYLKSIRRYYDYDNFKPLIESEAICFPSTKAELTSDLTLFQNNSNYKAESRRELAKVMCGFLDGHCTTRLFNELIS